MNILYIGLDPHTPSWLAKHHSIRGVADIEEYLQGFLWWPPDCIFRAIYGLQKRGARPLARTSYHIGAFLLKYCSPVLKRYTPFLSIVIQNNIPIVLADVPSRLKDFVRTHEVEVIVVNAWSLLPLEVISLPLFKTVNVHPSKLPQYRGAVPTLFALKNHDPETAVTFSVIGGGVDDGAVLAQYPIPIAQGETALTLEKKIGVIVENHLAQDIQRYGTGAIVPRPQEGTPSLTAKYSEYQKINFQEETVEDVGNKVMLYPFLEPGVYCYTQTAGHRMYIRNGIPARDEIISAGSWHVRGSKLIIGARDGAIAYRLFRDIGIKDSVYFLFSRHGIFAS